mmetsp:Transcript_16449/g.62511  ORF Transcript_16449/g.62511 Transcript_16449/m.62511 type:complete len:205 (-) Transcript_16449:482-1096(-)
MAENKEPASAEATGAAEESAPGRKTLGEAVAELDAEDAEIVKTSAEAISRLVFGKQLEKERTGQGGAITAIVRAFGRHLQDRETVLVLLKLFRHVCFGVSGNVELAARNGGIVAVASCLRSHVDDEDIVAEAFWVLSVLGKHPGSEGVVARVRSDIEAAAARHPEHPQIMAKGMYLAALAQGPSDEGGKDEAQASESAEAEGKA